MIEKLSTIADKSDYIPTGSEIVIDLSSWNRDDQLAFRIREIKKAIGERNVIEFMYYSNGTLTKRRAEPCVIVFKETNWYLYAYCLLREDFRLFKLRRMRDIRTTDVKFETRQFALDGVNWDGEVEGTGHSTIVALFDQSVRYVIDDIFGAKHYETTADGRLKAVFPMAVDGWLYGFLLGFGDRIEILEPVELRDRIKDIAKSIYRIYEQT